MLKKTIRIVYAGLLTSLVFFLVLFCAAEKMYPDSISRYRGEEVESLFCFSYSPEKEESASANARRETGEILAFGILPVKSVEVTYFQRMALVPGGELVGVKLRSRGILVSDVGEVKTSSGSFFPGKDAGILPGDILLSAGGVELENGLEFMKILAKSNGEPLAIVLEREGKEMTCTLSPVLSEEGGYKAGLWIRESAAGIGTVTYFDPASGTCAALGHGICDGNSGILFPVRTGTLYQAVPEGVEKGKAGSPGSLRGSLGKAELGTVNGNSETGVYGNAALQGKAIPIALRGEVKKGAATILCTLSKEGKKEYRAEIEEICDPNGVTKNFILHVTDPALLEQTGGIVQGMSGSPVLQNGKLVGAVTHVLVSDPTRGYGIFIENMLEAGEGIAGENNLKMAS